MSDEIKPCDKCNKVECERTEYPDEPCEYIPKCEFCNDKEATIWLHHEDAHHLCKVCYDEWHKQPTGWW